ncbi:hypothetical protein [Leptospira sp. GIMC2001]|uniref:hypothetical protein n=1 Tax=Leptospira sp. GIMC2001 TaxID=1513297 RepID=UPI002349083B|nr:hypothetical protein [Leptospira sp. GIMC2001]WCL50757.1 hypothetical protein O4O04_08075 [Leptospira sp. GIMC2001]
MGKKKSLEEILEKDPINKDDFMKFYNQSPKLVLFYLAKIMAEDSNFFEDKPENQKIINFFKSSLLSKISNDVINSIYLEIILANYIFHSENWDKEFLDQAESKKKQNFERLRKFRVFVRDKNYKASLFPEILLYSNALHLIDLFGNLSFNEMFKLCSVSMDAYNENMLYPIMHEEIFERLRYLLSEKYFNIKKLNVSYESLEDLNFTYSDKYETLNELYKMFINIQDEINFPRSTGYLIESWLFNESPDAYLNPTMYNSTTYQSKLKMVVVFKNYYKKNPIPRFIDGELDQFCFVNNLFDRFLLSDDDTIKEDLIRENRTFYIYPKGSA